MAAKKNTGAALADALRTYGLTYPEAHTKSPWPGHLDLAVRDKTFAHLSAPGEPFSMSCKLPESAALALLFPFASPTGYGLGRSGWVTFKPVDDGMPPLELCKSWIDESYRAVAPKKLVAALVSQGDVSGGAEKRPAKRSVASTKGGPKKAGTKVARAVPTKATKAAKTSTRAAKPAARAKKPAKATKRPAKAASRSAKTANPRAKR